MGKEKHSIPNLSEIKKENSFKVPDNYFEDFSARLQIKLEEEKNPAPEKQNQIIKLLKPAIGMAASFALIFMLVYWPLKKFMPTQDQFTINETETELSEEDYLNVVERLDENSFFALLYEEEDGTEFSDEELASYVSANISEYELYAEF